MGEERAHVLDYMDDETQRLYLELGEIRRQIDALMPRLEELRRVEAEYHALLARERQQRRRIADSVLHADEGSALAKVRRVWWPSRLYDRAREEARDPAVLRDLERATRLERGFGASYGVPVTQESAPALMGLLEEIARESTTERLRRVREAAERTLAELKDFAPAGE